MQNDVIFTADIWPGILLSVMKFGILPPGVLDVAIRHSIVPSSDSSKRSIETYRPFVTFSSSLARSSSPGPNKSTGIETTRLDSLYQRTLDMVQVAIPNSWSRLVEVYCLQHSEDTWRDRGRESVVHCPDGPSLRDLLN
jgi:hypothetical protein